VLPEFFQKLGLPGLEGGDEFVEVLLGVLDDCLCVLLEGEFGVADVEEDGLSLLELEESVLGGEVDAAADVLGPVLYLGDGVALVCVEHEAGGADHAAWGARYQ